MIHCFRNRPSGATIAAMTLLLCSAFSTAAHAVPIQFTTDPGNSSARFTDTSGFCVGLGAGCTPVVVVNPTPVTFSLDTVGEFFDIMDFLTVSITGPSLAFGGEATLEADIAFSSPGTAISTAASGTGRFSSLFIFRSGEVSWQAQPANLLFDDGTEVALAFGGGHDSCFLWGCNHGLSVGVDARTTLQAVPEPGVLALIGAGLFGFGVYRRSGGHPIAVRS